MRTSARLARRKTLQHLACGLLASVSLAVAAAGYPERAVQMVVNVQAGGSTDVAARLLAQKLAERPGQSFLVDNTPGAATRIGDA